MRRSGPFALALLAATLLASCATAAPRTDTPIAPVAPTNDAAPIAPTPERPPFPAALAGAWKVEDSTAVFVLAVADGILDVSGYDSTDGEEFVITEVSWDAQEFRFTSLMPSTRFKVDHLIRIAKGDVLRGKRSGSSSGPETLRRKD